MLIAHCSGGLIRKGNDLYKKGNYSEAEVNYLKSLQKSKLYNKGLFNLGDAYYKEKNYEKAGSAFQSYGSSSSDKSSKSKAFYNLGNSLFRLANLKTASMLIRTLYVTAPRTKIPNIISLWLREC